MACLTGLGLGDPLTWDATGSTPNTPSDGNGFWDTNAGNAVWSNVATASAGTAVDSAWNNSANNVAVFGNETANAQITIESGNVTASGLIFNNTANNPALGYIIGSTGSNESLTLSGPAPTITTNANATIQAEIEGSGGLTKNGSGTLTLMDGSAGAGYVSNVYSGTTTIAAGQLVLDGYAVIPGNMTINSGASVVTEQVGTFNGLGNGTVTVNGSLIIGTTPGTGDEIVGGLAGTGTVTLGQGTTAALTLRLTASQTFAGTLAGQGNVLVAGPVPNGTLVETWSGTNTFSGTTSVYGSILSVNSLSALGTASGPKVLLDYGGTLRYTGAAASTGTILSLGVNGSGIDASGTGALTVGASVTGANAGPTSTLTLTGTSTAANTLQASLVDPGSATALNLVKTGVGTWNLSSGIDLFTGGTQIYGGTLELLSGASLGTGNVAVNGTGALEVASPSVSLASGSGKTFTAGGGTLILNNSSVVTLSSVTRTSGGGLVIVPTSNTSLGTTQKVGVTTGLTPVNGMVDGSFVAETSPTDSTGDFLTYNNTNGFVRATYSTATAITNGVSGGTTSTSIFHATAATNDNVASATQLYALKIDAGVTVGGAAITLGDGTHTAGLIINSNSSTLPTTVLSAITFATGSEGAVYVGGNVSSNPTATPPTARILGVVSGTNGLTKSGTGTLELANAHYTGATTINQGTIVFDGGSGSVLGPTSTLNLAGAALFNTPSGTVAATINLTGDGTVGASAGSSVALSGIINGGGHTLNISNATSTGTITFIAQENNLPQVNVNLGTLQAVGNIGFPSSAGLPTVYVNDATNSNQSTLSITGGYNLTNAVVLNGGDLSGGTYSNGVSTLSGSLTVQSGFGYVVNTAGDLNLTGSIQGSVPLYFKNTGAGTITISGTSNTLTGNTEIIYGKVAVTGNIASSARVDVGSAPGSTATLSGTGTVGPIDLMTNGKLSPGLNGVGTLSATGMTWNSDGTAQLQFDLGATASASSELNLGTGAFTKGTGSAFTFDFLNSGVAGQTYTLVNFGANDTNFLPTDFASSDLSQGLSGQFSLVNNGTTESLEFAVVPEPGTTGLLATGALGLLLFAKRRSFTASVDRRD